ncbi:hypothetical protein D3C73_1367670 [compost metagenome]
MNYEKQEELTGREADSALCRYHHSASAFAFCSRLLCQGDGAVAGIQIISKPGQFQSQNDGKQPGGYYDQSG